MPPPGREGGDDDAGTTQLALLAKPARRNQTYVLPGGAAAAQSQDSVRSFFEDFKRGLLLPYARSAPAAQASSSSAVTVCTSQIP